MPSLFKFSSATLLTYLAEPRVYMNKPKKLANAHYILLCVFRQCVTGSLIYFLLFYAVRLCSEKITLIEEALETNSSSYKRDQKVSHH